MRKTVKIPRILKINSIHGFIISVTFNNGESRLVDFKEIVKKLKIQHQEQVKFLLNHDEYLKVQLDNNTLSWPKAINKVVLSNGSSLELPFEIGADVLFYLSKPEKSELLNNISRMVKDTRIKSGLTQQELAIKSGTSRNYISRIENAKSDIEIGTLRKILELGLGKKMDIVIS
jgi:DNA-binding XRE family transcriptional regulator